MALGFGFGPIYEKAGQGNYIQFIAPGVISMGILFTAVFSGIEIIWDRQFGFLKETLVAPVLRIQIVLGRTLGGATVPVFHGLIVLGVCTIAGFRFHDIFMFPVAVLFMFLIALLFTSLGTAIASVLKDMQGFQFIMNFLVMPFFFFFQRTFPYHRFAPHSPNSNSAKPTVLRSRWLTRRPELRVHSRLRDRPSRLGKFNQSRALHRRLSLFPHSIVRF